VRIPAGSFLMGSNPGERNRRSSEGDEQGDKHSVTIANDFYIGETEVTQAQWEALMNSNPANSYGVGNDHPVYYVSWNDIKGTNGFLDTLDANTAYSGFRLPTEAEWEYACRAGTNTRFYFGDADSASCDDQDDDCAAELLGGTMSDYMWYYGNNNDPYGSKPVGTLTANQFGLFDMHGNLWEWCEDYWHGNYVGAPTNGSAWISPVTSYRVVRGADWGDSAGPCRSAVRSWGGLDGTGRAVGFRVVLPASSKSF
jgi:formylglycine-generating enzyme required for sulfatase activity